LGPGEWASAVPVRKKADRDRADPVTSDEEVRALLARNLQELVKRDM
jgi:hypothetical protein